MEKKIKYYPLKILLTFLVITELLIFIGPISYDIGNSMLLIIYLLLLNYCLYKGYKLGIKKFVVSSVNIPKSVVSIIVILGLILSLYSINLLWERNGLSLSLRTLVDAINNPGEAYYSESKDPISTNFVMLLLSPIQWASVPIGIATWKRNSKFIKLLVILNIFIQIIAWLEIGTRKGIIDILLVVLFCFIALNPQIIITNKSRQFKLILVIIIILFLLYFIFSNISRYGLTNFSELSTLDNGKLKSFYRKHFPIEFSVALLMITGYLTQGYYALSKGLELGVLSPSFMGSSWFTIALAKKFDYNPIPNTYMALLEPQGIDMSVNWHTIYLWLANDFTFIGVPFVIFFIGYFFAQSWCDSVYSKNIFSYPVLALFVIMVFYFFANNQIFSFSFIPFIVCFSLYLIARRFRL